MINSYNSQLLDNAVSALSKLPGIGEKTALRLALYLLRQPEEISTDIGESVIKLRQEITYCSVCHNISDEPICKICSDKKRNHKKVCVVENVKDVLAIENTNKYNGLYHVIGGLISPAEGISPSSLEIDSLVERVRNEDIDEIILALSPNMEGETTSYYIFRRLEEFDVEITILAQGLSVGGEIEYADQLTLGRSIVSRVPYEKK